MTDPLQTRDHRKPRRTPNLVQQRYISTRTGNAYSQDDIPGEATTAIPQRSRLPCCRETGEVPERQRNAAPSHRPRSDKLIAWRTTTQSGQAVIDSPLQKSKDRHDALASSHSAWHVQSGRRIVQWTMT